MNTACEALTQPQQDRRESDGMHAGGGCQWPMTHSIKDDAQRHLLGLRIYGTIHKIDLQRESVLFQPSSYADWLLAKQELRKMGFKIVEKYEQQ